MTISAPRMTIEKPLFFGLWDEPWDCEPAHGLFLRVAHRNGLPSTQLVAFQAEIEGRNLRPEECLELMLRHPMAGASDLVFNTPKLIGKEVELRGHRFRRRDWSIAFRRHCPGCLAESAHHRTWWDLSFMRVCPFHGVRIAGGRDDEVAVGWNATNLAWSGERGLAAETATRLAMPQRSLESYVLGRMGVMSVAGSSILDDRPLSDVVSAVQGLGALVLGGLSASKPRLGRGRLGWDEVQAAGFAAADAGGEGIEAALLEVFEVAALTADPRGELGVSAMFGWGYKAFQDSGNPLLNMVADKMVAMAVADGRIRRSKSLVSGRTDEFGRMTLKEVASEIGLPRPAVADLAKRLLKGFDRGKTGLRVFLDRADVDVLKTAARAAMSRSGAARRLGLRNHEFRYLRTRGLIKPIVRRRKFGEAPELFHHKDVERLLSAGHAPSGSECSPARTVAFELYAKVLDVDCARLAVMVVRRKVRPVGRTDESMGFRGLLFELPERAGCLRLKDRNRTRITRDGLTFAEVAGHLGVNQATVAELVRRRLLAALDASKTGSGFRRITVSALRSFNAQFITAKSLAGPLGCHASNACRKLKAMGFRPIVEPGYQARFNAVFRQVDLPVELLASVPNIGRDPFWESFSKFLNAAGTTFRSPPSIRDGEAFLRNSGRTAAVRITVDDHALVMSVDCDALKSPRRMAMMERKRGTLESDPSIRVIRHGTAATVQACNNSFVLDDPETWESTSAWAAELLRKFDDVFSRGQIACENGA